MADDGYLRDVLNGLKDDLREIKGTTKKTDEGLSQLRIDFVKESAENKAHRNDPTIHKRSGDDSGGGAGKVILAAILNPKIIGPILVGLAGFIGYFFTGGVTTP